MNTCWKCRASLRVADAAFCPVCGTRQKRDEGLVPPIQTAAPPQWNTRIEQATARPGWGMAILWTILFPLAPFTYPVLLMSANNRLRRHIAGHAASPAMQSPRVTQVPEGRAVLDRLLASGGRVSTAGVLPFLLSILLLGICCFSLFIVPAQAPRPIGYERSVECVMEVRSAPGYVYIDSPAEYESFWSDYPTWAYDDITVSTSNYGRDGNSSKSRATGLPTYERSTRYISSYEHPPYEYLSPSQYGVDSQYNRVSALYLYWDGTETAGVFFWIAAIGLYITNLIFGLVFWFRFMRHREAETLAAAYAVGDPAMHDRLLPLVRQRNAVFTWVVIPLSVTGLHMLAFPLLAVAMFSRHADWEQRSGIAAAFALQRP